LSLNTRQQLYKKYRIEGYSKYTSARKAGYSHSYASQAKRVEKHINMDFWLEKAGLTDTYLAKIIQDGVEATRVISAMVSPTGKQKDANGQTCDYIDVPDWSVRHKFIETALKLREKFSDKPLVDQSIKQIVQIYRPEPYSKQDMATTSRATNRSV